MERRVAAPRAPGLGALLEGARARASRGAPENEVARGERVGIAVPEGHVAPRPRADSRDPFGGAAGSRERADRPGTGAREPGERRALEGRRGREQAVEPRLPRHRLAVLRDEPRRESPRARDRDLLPEDSAHGELEAVPRSRDAEPRARRDERREEG